MDAKPEVIDPALAASLAIDRLKGCADPRRAASLQRYFKSPVAALGADNESFKAVSKDLLRQVRKSWGLGEAVSFCRYMLREPHLEVRSLGFLVVAEHVDEADATLLPVVRQWLEQSCDSWALVDNLAPLVLGPLLGKHAELVDEVVGWSASESLWVRRGAVVGLIPLVKEGKHLDGAYAVALRLFGDSEDLIHKAVGWLLREAGKQDMDRLECFLLEHGPAIPRTTVRYAIERFPKEERSRLLQATRRARAAGSETEKAP